MLFLSHNRLGSSRARRTRASVGLFAVALGVAMGLVVSGAFAAQSAVDLGTADSFAVLAGSTVTNTGPSTINGELGVSPGTAVTGFPPGTVNGSTHAADAVAAQAQSDLTSGYNDAASRHPAVLVSGDLGGLVLTPGVYKASSSIGLTGTLTLDAQGDPNAVFVFQVSSTLTTASASHVKLINGAQACNVFWQIGSSATLGTSSVFAGDILALTSISINNGVTVDGRVLARNGAVTLINDTVSAAQCSGGTGTTTTGTTTTGTTTTGTTTTGTTTTGTTTTGTTTTTTPGPNGTGILTTVPRVPTTNLCQRGRFKVVVTGLFIRQVVFSLGKRVIATRRKSPFEAFVKPTGGIHTVTARVTFTDGTSAAKLHLRIRACAAATRPVAPPRPPNIPPGITG